MHLSNEQWCKIAHLFPSYTSSKKGGRPRLNRKQVFEGILYVFQEKIPWKTVPKVFGSGSALNKYFREWSKEGVFHRLKENHFKLLYNLDWEKIDSSLRKTSQKSLSSSLNVSHSPRFTKEVRTLNTQEENH